MSTGVARETGSHGPSRRSRAVARETAAARGAGGCDHDHEGGAPAPGLPARLALAPIRFYRRRLSPLLGARCRYYPTCSAYAEQAVSELGLFRGSIVAFWRLLRCNPFSPGGIDPLESRRLFRSEDAGADAGRREEPA